MYIFTVAQMVKNRSPVQETQVRSLSGEDPLEEEMSTHSSILAWEVPWTEEAGGLQSTGLQSWMQLSNHMHTGSALWKGFERRL